MQYLLDLFSMKFILALMKFVSVRVIKTGDMLVFCGMNGEMLMSFFDYYHLV